MESINREHILEQLNDRQAEAVQAISGSTLVIAGAGSGKTSVLTRRNAYLISSGVTPGQILCLTFTNKAAAEMNSRVLKLLEDLGHRLPIVRPWQNDYIRAPLLCTFHSLGLRLLREFGDRLDYKSTFTILDSDDQKKIVKDLIKAKGLDPKNMHHDLVLYFIGLCKQELLLAQDSRKIVREFLPVFHQLYHSYEQTLRQSQAVDFDDLIMLPYLLMRDHEDIRLTLQDRWHHVMVDEFQDTNQAQFELIRMLCPEELLVAGSGNMKNQSKINSTDSVLKRISAASNESTPNDSSTVLDLDLSDLMPWEKPEPEASNQDINQTITPDIILNGGDNSTNSRSLFVVGDDAQSIYSFRGSKVEIILNFEYEYSDTRTIVLNQNYRSTQPILDLAEKIISLNPLQKKKDLFTSNTDQIQIKYFLARNEQAEAEYILKQLQQQYGREPDTSSNPGLTSDSAGVEEDVQLLYDEGYAEDKSANSVFAPPGSGSDVVAQMFDVYLELDQPQTKFQTWNKPNLPQWSVPSYDWTNMPQLNDVAILYRTHGQSRSLEEVFLRYKLPYRLASGTRFLDRKEIRDTIALLKYIQNNEDMLSLKRVLPLLLDGVGPKTMDRIITNLQNPDEALPNKVAPQLYDFFKAIQTATESHISLINFTKEVFSTTGYLRYLKAEYPLREDYEARLENIGEIYSLMFPFDNSDDPEFSNRPVREKLQAFLEQVSLMSNLDNLNEAENTPKITLMSLHQSKGLEFETIFLVGVEDGILPHINSFEDPRGIEEEIRLAYVGVTRAKRYLHLVAAESRIQYGQIKANPVSRIFRPLLDKYASRVR